MRVTGRDIAEAILLLLGTTIPVITIISLIQMVIHGYSFEHMLPVWCWVVSFDLVIIMIAAIVIGGICWILDRLKKER